MKFFLVLFSKNNKNPNFFNHHSCLGFVCALEAPEGEDLRICVLDLTFPFSFFASYSIPSLLYSLRTHPEIRYKVCNLRRASRIGSCV